MVQNGTKWHGMVPNGVKWYRMLTNDVIFIVISKYFKRVLMAGKWNRIRLNHHIWLNVIENGSLSSKIVERFQSTST